MHPLISAFPADTQTTLHKLVDLFLAENAITNLSALRTKDACFTGNVLDSLAFELFANNAGLKEGNMLLDVGTGGGFPLLPIAVTHPTLRCHGLEAIAKKGAAVERMAQALGLTNVGVIRDRSEPAGQDKKYRERFNVVTARAVAPLPVLLEYCAPFVQQGGCLVLWKSLQIQKELDESRHAQRILGLGTPLRVSYDLGGDWGNRQLLVYTKERPTPKEYPRKVGEAKHHPITDRTDVEGKR